MRNCSFNPYRKRGFYTNHYPYPIDDFDDFYDFDPVASRRLRLDPRPYPYAYSYPYYSRPVVRRSMHLSPRCGNNFYIDNAFINIEDGYWNEMDRKWKAHLRSLWDDDIDCYLGTTTFKRYR